MRSFIHHQTWVTLPLLQLINEIYSKMVIFFSSTISSLNVQQGASDVAIMHYGAKEFYVQSNSMPMFFALPGFQHLFSFWPT